MKEYDEILLQIQYGENPTRFQKAKYQISLLKKHFLTKLQDTMAVISGKRLKDSKNYEGAPRVDEETVETNPERWIIPECIPACKILWSKNIYTFMCSDRVDQNAWIEIKLENLSEENLKILEELKQEYTCYSYHTGCINISVTGMGKKAMLELIKIANRFSFQDVPEKEACYKIEDALIVAGCKKKVPNPNYITEEEYFKLHLEIKEWERYRVLADNWFNFTEQEIEVIDKTKIKQPLEENFTNTEMILDIESERVYRSNFHYQKHLNYLKYLEEKSKKRELS